jgi:uncharacterized protein (DUF58 family)
MSSAVQKVETPRTPAEVHYRLGPPACGQAPGQHRSRGGTSGFEFRGHVPLFDAPDVRRIDLHASLRDPFGDWRVRVYRQRKAVPVIVVADLSASMNFQGQVRRLDVLADLVESLAISAWRSGDRFGFIGCDAGVRPEWLQLPTRLRSAGSEIARRLRGWRGTGNSAAGIAAAAQMLPAQRALVFLVSDFHLPPELAAAALASLSAHDLVPVVLRDPLEFELGAVSGLAPLVDLESGRQRLVWWRPALRARWQAEQAARRAALVALMRQRGLRPLFIEAGFDADAVTRHFHA